MEILEYLHLEKYYIYRDLKASNIIVNTTGKIFLVDFGFAKKLGKGSTSSFLGTLHSMAPEFFMPESERKYSFEVDVYALGILLYELTVGSPPFGYGNKDFDHDKSIEKKI